MKRQTLHVLTLIWVVTGIHKREEEWLMAGAESEVPG